MKHTEKIIAIVESEKDRLIRYYGINPSRIEVIPNGVDTDEFDAVPESEALCFREERGLTDRPVVLFVGRISRIKGPDILVNAALNLLSKGINATFMIVGHKEDPELHEELSNLVHQAGLSDKILFEELPRREIIRAFKACDVVVLPSRGEVFGITLVEGMYCEKVVIGADSGGIPEVIEDGRSGYLFKSEDSESLSGVLEDVLGGYAQLGGIRQAAKRRVLENYTWKSIAKQLQAIYRELVS